MVLRYGNLPKTTQASMCATTGTTDAKLRESDSRPALKAGDTVSLMTVLFGIKSSTV